MRYLIFSIFLLQVCTAQAFTVLRYGDLKGWQQKPLTISYNPANCPSDMASVMAKASAIWSSVLDSSLVVNVNSDSTCTPSQVWNGTCSDAFAIACDTNFTATAGASAMGIANITTDGGRTINRGMVLLNVEGGGGILQATEHFRLVVVTHEIGHALGFGHSDDSLAMMRSGGNTGGNPGLSYDDQQGVRYLYPGNELDQKQILGCALVAASSGSSNPPPPWAMALILIPLLCLFFLRFKDRFSKSFPN